MKKNTLSVFCLLGSISLIGCSATPHEFKVASASYLGKDTTVSEITNIENNKINIITNTAKWTFTKGNSKFECVATKNVGGEIEDIQCAKIK